MNPDEQNNPQPTVDTNGMPNAAPQSQGVFVGSEGSQPAADQSLVTPEVAIASQPQPNDQNTVVPPTESIVASAQSPASVVAPTPPSFGAPETVTNPEQSQAPVVGGGQVSVPGPTTPGVAPVSSVGGQKNTMPLVLIGIGVVLIITILGLVFL